MRPEWMSEEGWAALGATPLLRRSLMVSCAVPGGASVAKFTAESLGGGGWPARQVEAALAWADRTDALKGIDWFGVLGWLVLVLLLLRVLSQLSAIYALLRPHAAKPPALLEMPALLLRKARLVLYGACFLVLSKDKVTSKQLKKAPDAAHATGPVEKKVRLVFIRHGESMWNYAFNRGFKPSFLWRWLETTLYELYLLPLEDSAYAAQLVGAQFGGAQFGAIPPRNSAAQFLSLIHI